MERRIFLKRLAVTGVAVTAVPTAILKMAEKSVEGANIISKGGITIDFTNKLVKLDGPEPISLKELYQYLKDEWRNGEQANKYRFPVKMATEEIMIAQEGYRVAPLEMIHSGTYIEYGEVWSSHFYE